MLNGVINIYKEKGLTSHDVVNRLRRILGQKKIGHTGTLDPQAEGVLPVCLGAGTKLCDMFQDTGKEYRCVMLLGTVTDTQDIFGEVLETHPVEVTEEEAGKAALSFIGTYEQVPPMYSAVKVNGRKLYELARRGIEVERKSRRVTIDDIRIEAADLPRMTMTIACSKGTYIRTLCEDIGRRLGCGACMESLVRTRVGQFRIEDALTLDQVRSMTGPADPASSLEASADRCSESGEDAGIPADTRCAGGRRIEEHIIQIDTMFPEAPKARVRPDDDLYIHNGNPFRKRDLILEDGAQFAEHLRLYDSDGIFMGLYVWEGRRHLYRPEKMFLPF